MILDITEKLQNRQALKTAYQKLAIERKRAESEKRWQLAIHGTNDGLWDWNPQTNEVFSPLNGKPC